MYSVTFPYQRRGFQWLPIVPVTLFGRTERVLIEAYVDSGASCSIFELGIADHLRIDLRNARKRSFKTGDGRYISGCVIRMPVQIGDYKFISEVVFSDELKVGFNLIGRRGIFEEFDEITFREKRREIEFVLEDS